MKGLLVWPRAPGLTAAALILTTTGRSVGRRIVPVLAVLAVLAGYVPYRWEIFAAIGQSRPATAVTVGAWLLLTSAAARETFAGGELAGMLAYPVARWYLGAAVVATWVLANCGFVTLWVKAGAPAALTVGALTVAGFATIAAAPLSRVWTGCMVLLVSGCFAPTPVTIGAAVLVTFVAARAGIRNAAEHPASGGKSLVRRRPLMAVAAATLTTVWRAERSLLSRDLLIAAVTGALAGLAARNNSMTRASSIGAVALGLGAVTAAVAGIDMAGASGRAHGRNDDMLRALGSTEFEQHAARLAVAVCCGATMGSAHGLVAALLLSGSIQANLHLLVGSIAWTSCIAAFISSVGIRPPPAFTLTGQQPLDTGRLARIGVGTMVAAVIAVCAAGEWGAACLTVAMTAATAVVGLSCRIHDAKTHRSIAASQ